MTADVAIAWVLIIGTASLLGYVELEKSRRARRRAKDLDSPEMLLRRIRREERDRPVMGDFDV